MFFSLLLDDNKPEGAQMPELYWAPPVVAADPAGQPYARVVPLAQDESDVETPPNGQRDVMLFYPDFHGPLP